MIKIKKPNMKKVRITVTKARIGEIFLLNHPSQQIVLALDPYESSLNTMHTISAASISFNIYINKTNKDNIPNIL